MSAVRGAASIIAATILTATQPIHTIAPTEREQRERALEVALDRYNKVTEDRERAAKNWDFTERETRIWDRKEAIALNAVRVASEAFEATL